MKIVEKEIILFDKVSISRNILSIEIFATIFATDCFCCGKFDDTLREEWKIENSAFLNQSFIGLDNFSRYSSNPIKH